MRPEALFAVVFVVICGFAAAARAQMDGCDFDPATLLPVAFNASGVACKPIWSNFILRYSQSQDNILSIILSAVYVNGWIGIGFSKDGMMVGSSAMVGWIDNGAKANIKQYYLGGQSSSLVTVNDGNLLTTNVSPVVVLYGSNIYLAFQLRLSSPINNQYLLFAYSTTEPENLQLGKHTDEVSVLFDFLAGNFSILSYQNHLKSIHGMLNIFGWGVLLPVGAMVARHLKERDPLWFFLHVAIQFSGFILGLAGVVAGIALYHMIHSNVSAHKGIGIFIFVLSIVQVSAFFYRPEKGSKITRYWKFYHHWAGRLSIFLSFINIVYGIHVGGAGRSWKVGYGVAFSFLLIASIGLEIFSHFRQSKKAKTETQPPAFQMQAPPKY